MRLREMAFAFVFVFITMLLLLKKLIFQKQPTGHFCLLNGQICLLKGHFCILKGHFCFLKIRLILDFSAKSIISQQFFRDRYHQNSATGIIYKRLFIKTSIYNNKDRNGFFWFFVRNKNSYFKKRNWFNETKEIGSIKQKKLLQ